MVCKVELEVGMSGIDVVEDGTGGLIVLVSLSRWTLCGRFPSPSLSSSGVFLSFPSLLEKVFFCYRYL
jgi:hypothetical protein